MNVDGRLKLSLLENAKSSLRHAVTHLPEFSGVSVVDYKYAIRDTVHAVELLFKERLQRIHPAFIWTNVDKYLEREAHTVNLDEARKRLTKFADIDFTQKHIENIQSIKKLRNDLEHFDFEVDERLARTHIGRMLSFIFWFSREHLDLEWEEEFKKDNSWTELINIHQFFEEHVAVVEKRVSDEQRYLDECPECGAYTFDMEGEKCHMCGHSAAVFECEKCGERYFERRMSEYIEGWCLRCEEKDAEASMHEKY